jgi:hypothetical protein
MELKKIKNKRLGRLRPETPPHLNPNVLHFKKYVDPKWEAKLRKTGVPMPALRKYRDWVPFVQPQLPNGFGMMLNDTLGDCTVAAVGHAIQLLTGVDGTVVTPTDAQVLTMYEASGYVPGDPDTDQGWLIQSALKYWQKTGLAGHKIGAFVSIDPSNELHVDLALEIFGFVNIGIYLPASAQNQNLLWSVPTTGIGGDGEPGSWGGHSIVIHKRCETPVYRRSVITWGQPEWHITPNAWEAYVDEAWTGFTTDWLRNGKSPSGFDKATLLADLKNVSTG